MTSAAIVCGPSCRPSATEVGGRSLPFCPAKNASGLQTVPTFRRNPIPQRLFSSPPAMAASAAVRHLRKKTCTAELPGPGPFFCGVSQRGNGVPIFHSRDVAPLQPGAFLDVPLRKVLLLAQSPQTFSDHRSFLPCCFACSQTKAGTEWKPVLWLLRAGIPFDIRLHIARCQGKQH